MGEDLLTLGNILTVAGLAGVFLALAKHWYRMAQGLLVLAMLMADAKILRWAINTTGQPLKVRIAVAVVGMLSLTVFTIWAVKNARPKLTIAFIPNTTPYDEPEYVGEDGDTWKSYRVSVTSSVPTTVILRAEGVGLDGNVRHNMHLHYMHDTKNIVKRVELFKDTPDFWDVVLKASNMDHALLAHIHDNVSKTLIPRNREFKLVATSRDGSVKTSIALAELNADNNLVFRLKKA